MITEQVAAGIRERETESIPWGVADPAIFAEDGGPSIAERMLPVIWKPADNKRVARHGQLGGWDQMRQRMIGEDGRPMIYCFSFRPTLADLAPYHSRYRTSAPRGITLPLCM